MAWWLKNNLRMIQNNIRDIDADMDVDSYIKTLKEFGANVLQIGCGGISSFFPTKLPYQTPSPYLKGDLIGEVVEKAHKNGIRVIARFDFSKTHVRMLEDHPDWYYRKADGSPLLYHDTAATCVNGQYQQEHSLAIIREVIEKYPVDGIFFNMFGYMTSDYSGNYSGICQCDNCKRRFGEMFGETLPMVEDEEDPVFRNYQKFKEITVGEILEKIRRTAKSVSEDIAVSTYTDQSVDIVRNESNSALDRALPFWIYNSADNVGLIEGGFDDKISSNCAINAVDLPYRFMGVSKYLNQIRLYGDMAAGSGLDWCIIGSFEDYPDRENFESTREIFHFHRRYEKYYGHFDPMQKILLVLDGEVHGVNKEYRGLFRAFKEDHIQFRTMQISALEGFAKRTAGAGNPFDGFDFVFLPGVRKLSPAILAYLNSTTACVVGTGLSLQCEPDAARQLFGINIKETVSDVRGTYLLTEPKSVFSSFPEKDWVFLDKTYGVIALEAGTTGLLPKEEKAMFGPPERCFGHRETKEWMLAASDGGNLYFPWHIGALYYQYGYDEFKKLLYDALASVKPIPRPIVTDAPAMTEVFFGRISDNTYMLQLINLTGFNGITFSGPLVIPDISVKFADIKPQEIIWLSGKGEEKVNLNGNGELKFNIDKGELYRAYIIKV